MCVFPSFFARITISRRRGGVKWNDGDSRMHFDANAILSCLWHFDIAGRFISDSQNTAGWFLPVAQSQHMIAYCERVPLVCSTSVASILFWLRIPKLEP